MKLYELSAECEMMYQLLDDLEDNPELKQAYADTLEGLSGEFDEKAEAIAIIVKRFEAEAEAISQELRRMEERKNRRSGKPNARGNICCPICSWHGDQRWRRHGRSSASETMQKVYRSRTVRRS